MEKKDSDVYQSKICVFCENKNNCTKDKFKKFELGDKISFRCMEYKYELANKDEFIVY